MYRGRIRRRAGRYLHLRGLSVLSIIEEQGGSEDYVDMQEHVLWTGERGSICVRSVDYAGRMALHSVRRQDMFSHIHRVCGHMSDAYIKWHRENSKNAKFSDTDAKKVRPLCKACVYGENRQTSTDRHRIHRPLPTIEGQCFAVDAFACGHTCKCIHCKALAF